MPKRVLQGTVVSDTNNKTVVVRVDRAFTHPVMKKTVRRSKKYHAHDEANVAKVGQTVGTEEGPPGKLASTDPIITTGHSTSPATSSSRPSSAMTVRPWANAR